MLTLEFARRQKRMTLADVSELSRVGTYFISMAERGIYLPNANQLARLGYVLDAPPELLLQPMPNINATTAEPETAETTETATK